MGLFLPYPQTLANQLVYLSSPTSTLRNFLATLVGVKKFHEINH